MTIPFCPSRVREQAVAHERNYPLTSLSQAPYGLVTALINEMSRQGVSVEQIQDLLAAPKQLQQWVALLPKIAPSTGEMTIAELFPNDQRLVNLLFREGITTLAELTDCTAEEVQDIWQLGPDTFATITAALDARGLQYSENIENGARRIRVGNPHDKRTIRRDRIGSQRISTFIPIEQDRGINWREREDMTIDQFRVADTETQRRLFSSVEVERISNWIVANVR